MHNHKKPRLRDRTDRAWFSRLLRHPARKRSGSILTTPESARGYTMMTKILERHPVQRIPPSLIRPQKCCC